MHILTNEHSFRHIKVRWEESLFKGCLTQINLASQSTQPLVSILNYTNKLYYKSKITFLKYI